MKKIAIIGCSGSGKTALGLKLQKILNLPLYHLDYYYWKPNWQRPEFEDFQDKHNLLCDKDQWIIEGIYTSTLFYRLEKADTIIFLDFPRYLCIWRVIKRMIFNYGKQTPGAPEGCHEGLSWAFFPFIRWIWRYNKEKRPGTMELLDYFGDARKIHILKSPKDIARFIQKLTCRNGNDIC